MERDDLVDGKDVPSPTNAIATRSVREKICQTCEAVIVAVGGAIATYAAPVQFSQPLSVSVLREAGLRGRLSSHMATTPSAPPLSFAGQSSCATYDDVYRAACTASIAETMLTNIYNLVDAGQSRKAMVAVYDSVCGLLADGRLSECDRLLATVDPSKVDAKVLTSLLMATAQIPRDKLPSRVLIYDSAVLRNSHDAKALLNLKRYA